MQYGFKLNIYPLLHLQGGEKVATCILPIQHIIDRVIAATEGIEGAADINETVDRCSDYIHKLTRLY